MKIYIPLINLSNHGGVRVLVELANHLASKGLDIEIIIPSGSYNSVYKIKSDNIIINQIGPVINNKNVRYVIFLLLLPFAMKSNSIVIANFFPTFFPSLLGSLMKRLKVVYFIQDIESKYKSRLGKMLNFFCNLSYHIEYNTIKITANEYLKKELMSITNKEVMSINIGLSEPFINTPYYGSEKKFDVIFFLRKEKWKRVELLNDVVSILKSKYSLSPTVLGVSQDIGLLKAHHDILEAYKCPSNDEELIDCIDSSKLLLFTSSIEGFGLPPLECMSRGLPSVVFDCGGPSIYIKNGENSYIVYDAVEAAERIYELLNNTNKYECISNSAKISALYFSSKNGFNEFYNYLTNIKQ
ncbi:TPA: glycosyltransferase family 4 protein [Raoultella ornithinolytica]|uniref:glycosyltransferase family 4 protein n=1 Tax=Raoultella ornithinolytica TaxID=54291 RepID=UPI002A5AA8B9|nr:glycosyltransferase [Raoultella ornithinolytica]WPO25341.1 glycosyltransferase [Raoultella ornithinolytica]HBQ8757376.1 glycosyltransferase [Klebsiella quasipneumoniae]HEP0608914.1 glycosyltransferase [Raoultella ornithinolytica]